MARRRAGRISSIWREERKAITVHYQAVSWIPEIEDYIPLIAVGAES
jgi:hypothetical protein